MFLGLCATGCADRAQKGHERRNSGRVRQTGHDSPQRKGPARQQSRARTRQPTENICLSLLRQERPRSRNRPCSSRASKDCTVHTPAKKQAPTARIGSRHTRQPARAAAIHQTDTRRAGKRRVCAREAAAVAVATRHGRPHQRVSSPRALHPARHNSAPPPARRGRRRALSLIHISEPTRPY